MKDGRQPLNPMFRFEDELDNPNPRIIIMVGLPRTGKSTFVNNFVEAAARVRRIPFTVVSSDDIRRVMGVRYDPAIEEQVQYLCSTLAESLMVRQQNLVIDNVNLTEKVRQKWIRMAKKHNYSHIVCEVSWLPVDVHKKACRDHDYPWHLIEGMKRVYEPVEDKSPHRYELVEREVEA